MIINYEFEELCREKNAADGHDGYMDDDDNKVLTLEDIEKMKREAEEKATKKSYTIMDEAPKAQKTEYRYIRPKSGTEIRESEERKSYTIMNEFPKATKTGYRYTKAKTRADIRDDARKEAEEETLGESHEQTVIETDCPHCGTRIEEVVITEQDDEIICTKCVESIEIVFYESMYDYVKNADLSYYEISDGKIRETPFVEEIKPFDDSNFLIYPDSIEKDGKWYDHVNFGENEISYLLESELCETVFLIYTEESCGHYVTDGRVYETEKEANE